MKILKKLIELTKEKGNFNLEWNPHRSYYQTVEEYIKDHPDFFIFPSKEEKMKSINENTLVYLQWYPRTPIGFTVFAASNIKTLFEEIKKEMDNLV